MAKIAKMETMRTLYNGDQMDFWAEQLDSHGIEPDVIADINNTDLSADVRAQIVEGLIDDGDLPAEFEGFVRLIMGYDEAGETNFGGNGPADYVDRAMTDTGDTEARLVEGEACITDAGKYIAWSPTAHLCKGGVMVVNLKDNEE